mmetsp:Transcript_4839/g.9823  ORF Transcript_4839/g.9823 Transcript_4839/m.9823 type:complete len:201 (-) Transcript_4839:237-839(-)
MTRSRRQSATQCCATRRRDMLGGEFRSRLHPRCDGLLDHPLRMLLHTLAALALVACAPHLVHEQLLLALAEIPGRHALHRLQRGVNPRELNPMPIARDELATTAIGQCNMSSEASTLTPGTACNRTQDLIAERLTIAMLGHNSQDLQLIDVRGPSLGVHCVHDRAAQSVHNSLPLLSTQLPHDLQLLRHLIVLQRCGVES